MFISALNSAHIINSDLYLFGFRHFEPRTDFTKLIDIERGTDELVALEPNLNIYCGCALNLYLSNNGYFWTELDFELEIVHIIWIERVLVDNF